MEAEPRAEAIDLEPLPDPTATEATPTTWPTTATEPAAPGEQDGAGHTPEPEPCVEPQLEPGPGLAEVLVGLQQSLEQGLGALRQQFTDKLAYDQFKEQQVDRLHAELQTHKADLLLRAQQPLLRGLIRLHDDLGRLADALAERAGEQLTRERFQSYLAGFRDDVETLLDQHGVTRFEAPGESFDGRRQLAARTCQTAEPALVGQLAERLRPGFELGDSLLQKERVAVFVAAPNQVQEPQGGSR